MCIQIYISACAQGCVCKSQMSTLSSVVNEARLKIKLNLLNEDILLAHKEYTRVYDLEGVSEKLNMVLTLHNDLEMVKRRSLGTSTFEDKFDDARDARVAVLELSYEKRICHAFHSL